MFSYVNRCPNCKSKCPKVMESAVKTPSRCVLSVSSRETKEMSNDELDEKIRIWSNAQPPMNLSMPRYPFSLGLQNKMLILREKQADMNRMYEEKFDAKLNDDDDYDESWDRRKTFSYGSIKACWWNMQHWKSRSEWMNKKFLWQIFSSWKVVKFVSLKIWWRFVSLLCMDLMTDLMNKSKICGIDSWNNEKQKFPAETNHRFSYFLHEKNFTIENILLMDFWCSLRFVSQYETEAKICNLITSCEWYLRSWLWRIIKMKSYYILWWEKEKSKVRRIALIEMFFPFNNREFDRLEYKSNRLETFHVCYNRWCEISTYCAASDHDLAVEFFYSTILCCFKSHVWKFSAC